MSQLHHPAPPPPSTTTVGTATIGTADAEDLSIRTKELARDAKDSLAAKANEAGNKGMSALGKKLEQAADAVVERGTAITNEPNSPTVHRVADSVRGAGRYLDENDPSRLVTDIDAAVHNHPYRALAIGAACGWIIGRLFSK